MRGDLRNTAFTTLLFGRFRLRALELIADYAKLPFL